MDNLYNKYLGNIFGILSSVSAALYLLLIFFAGVNTMLIPSSFLNGNTVNFQMISSSSQILHIISSVFLLLFYVKYFFKSNSDKILKFLSIIFSVLAVAMTAFSSNIENLFLMVAINGILLSVFLFILCIANFYFVHNGNTPLIKLARMIMLLSALVALILVFSACTYYEITIALARETLGKILSVRKSAAISFIFYIFACILQIVQFALLYKAETTAKHSR